MTLTTTGKKTRTATIIILDSGLSTPNQLFMSGAKAMIGTALAPIAKRQEQFARRREARRQQGHDHPERRPDGQPADRLEQGRCCRLAERPATRRPVLAERADDRAGRRQWEPAQIDIADDELPGADRPGEDDDRGQVVPEPLQPTSSGTGRARCQTRRGGCGRHPIPPSANVRSIERKTGAAFGLRCDRLRAAPPQRLADGRDELEVAALLPRLDVARTRQVDLDQGR